MAHSAASFLTVVVFVLGIWRKVEISKYFIRKGNMLDVPSLAV